MTALRPSPLQNDPALEDYNVPQLVDKFIAAVNNAVNDTAASGHIMFNIGADFQYENANEYFKSLDRLIDAVNADGRVSAAYSTPLEYVRAVQSAGLSWTVKTEDFFPCTSCTVAGGVHTVHQPTLVAGARFSLAPSPRQ